MLVIVGVAAAVYNLPAGISLIRISKRLKKQTVKDDELIKHTRKMILTHSLNSYYRRNESELDDFNTLVETAFSVGIRNILLIVSMEICVVYSLIAVLKK